MLQHPALRRIVARLIFIAIGGAILGSGLGVVAAEPDINYPEAAPKG